jgi:chemotaxis methyl-accepting protein methylase
VSGAPVSGAPVGGAPVGGPVREATRLLVERTGMQVTDGLRERLAACLDRLARASGRPPERYAAGLARDPGAFQELLDCVTVQESGFFRHPDQFAALRREVLPSLEGPVVAWSAGCANGQEAYSLAMELAASGRPDWQVLATDISAAAVARVRAGRYSAAELAGLPADHRHWLRPAGDRWEVDPALRRRVRVEQANLTAQLPAAAGRCQVVFCRNVLIYLSREVARAFLDRLAAWLAPGGLVFLGYSEAVLPPTDRLRVTRVGSAHALRVAPQRAPEGPGGLWTAPPRSRPDRLRSPSGGPGADRAGSRAPGDADLAAAGEAEAGAAAAGRGDLGAAVAAFRRAVFLDPDRPGTWFQLGLALEATAGRVGARRAYAAALAALERCDQGTVRADLDGWPAEELVEVLRAKLAGPAEPGTAIEPAEPRRGAEGGRT